MFSIKEKRCIPSGGSEGRCRSLMEIYDLDRILRQPYLPGMLSGFSENLFALYAPGWGFDSTCIFRTGLDTGYAFPLCIYVDGEKISPSRATYRPSFIHSTALVSDPNGKKIHISGYKYIQEDDLAAVVLVAKNTGSTEVELLAAALWEGESPASADGWYIRAEGDGFGRSRHGLEKKIRLAPGERVVFRLAMAFSERDTDGAQKIRRFFKTEDFLTVQRREFGRWFRENIPYFECDDPQITQIYYYRWLTYRSNIRKTPAGRYIITEFLPNVSWAGKYNSIPAAAYMHFMEGRWVANPRYLNDYADFWFESGVNPRLYSFPVAAALYQRYLVDGDVDRLVAKLPDLMWNYDGWTISHGRENGLFVQTADRDGMEYSIGGDGFRPTINSYMYADAVAISQISALAGEMVSAKAYTLRADALRDLVQTHLWNPEDAFFEVLREGDTDLSGVRELCGYLPWVFHMPGEAYGTAFRFLTDPEGFAAPFGPTTVEQKHPDFMRENAHDCLWNGPSWPYATTQTLWAAANALRDYGRPPLQKSVYFQLLKAYAQSQYKDGYPWIAENLDPQSGKWIVDKPRSVHYNHSCFADLIITGYVGLLPAADSERLVIHPLAPEETAYFALERVCYRGHTISVFYDRDGERYGFGRGMRVFVDGVQRLAAPVLQPVTVVLSDLENAGTVDSSGAG